MAASAAALPALLLATGLALAVGTWGAIAFALPVVLMLRAARSGRRSSRRSRLEFEDRAAWRDAERQAVATVLRAALRPRRGAR